MKKLTLPLAALALLASPSHLEAQNQVHSRDSLTVVPAGGGSPCKKRNNSVGSQLFWPPLACGLLLVQTSSRDGETRAAPRRSPLASPLY